MREEIKSKLEEILKEVELDDSQFSIEMDNYNILLWYARGIVQEQEATNYFAMRSRQGYDVTQWKSWFHQIMALNRDEPTSQLSFMSMLDRYKRRD